ncbi:hypothetical protein C2845_PM10G06280 [Panicum miliaceum]|uniref:Uncharacterized protein n=1 Tax=Panicum miliaceum TaxID=4540 RepID=A0A3L6PF47_PANMI|nr:hypothetical protein C2845_PM10G06280 [Panicum miliaceum]
MRAGGEVDDDAGVQHLQVAAGLVRGAPRHRHRARRSTAACSPPGSLVEQRRPLATPSYPSPGDPPLPTRPRHSTSPMRIQATRAAEAARLDRSRRRRSIPQIGEAMAHAESWRATIFFSAAQNPSTRRRQGVPLPAALDLLARARELLCLAARCSPWLLPGAPPPRM